VQWTRHMEPVIVIVGKVSLSVAVFAIGLTTTTADVTYVLRRPARILRGLFVMFVVVPAVAVILALTFRLTPAVEVALAALSVSPTPALLSKRAMKASGQGDYSVSLLVVAALVAIVWVPLSVEIFERIFSIPLHMRGFTLARIMMTSVLGPLGAGVLVRAVAPHFAQSAAPACASISGAVLIIWTATVVLVMLRSMTSLFGNGTLAAIAGFAVVGLALGHLLGGPRLETRKVLALYAVSRHPGVAMAVVQANFPGQPLILAAIVLVLVVTALVTLPYLSWAKPDERKTAAGE